MQLEEVSGTNKNGKEWSGYTVRIGEYSTPLFFPSKIETLYIKTYLKKQAEKDFKGDDLNVEG